ncbi:rhamnogalacturonan acetylesterase [Flavobacterium sp. F-380]|uniref:Rhamnogalacturonan acetylesterase n=1 Tax=Flavobacterium kayseriense TaxID=2764714 RepID=A0ABR7J971_9FLAO|nr:rhamnogalacturonan acetylesterase [Flavobacterium kayseriense]MBC5842088.1 rhamnogalacturonan acetylesterase [Flavobacterium kayseriense]MBC5848618.1 rhamnogalacturonan acetylesterase [Flavobacterium kayseriense]
MKNRLMIILLITSSCFAQKTTIFSIGDSTMASKVNPAENPEHGWIQVLAPFFNSSIIIDNRAVNGRSTRSFLNENRWDSVCKILKKGDYVFIQFGHNDQKVEDPKRYTNPHTAYRYNLIKFVMDSRAKGATPILFSSIVRRNFNENGVLVDTHGDYPMETRLVAQQYNVPFIDLNYLTEKLEESYGMEESKKLHLHFKAGENSYYKQEKNDDTHLSNLGATEVAKLVIAALKMSDLDLKKHIK